MRKICFMPITVNKSIIQDSDSKERNNLSSPKIVSFHLANRSGKVIQGDDPNDDFPLFGWALCENGKIYPLYITHDDDLTPKPRIPIFITAYGVIYDTDNNEIIKRRRQMAQKNTNRILKALDVFDRYCSNKLMLEIEKIYYEIDFCIDFIYRLTDDDLNTDADRFRSAVVAFCEKRNVEFDESFFADKGRIG